MRSVYIVCAMIETIAFIGGGAWLTYSSDHIGWIIGGIVLAFAVGESVEKRLEAWTSCKGAGVAKPRAHPSVIRSKYMGGTMPASKSTGGTVPPKK